MLAKAELLEKDDKEYKIYNQFAPVFKEEANIIIKRVYYETYNKMPSFDFFSHLFCI